MADDPIQRIKQLDKERASLLSSAKKEALTRASEAIADLNALGFNVRLNEVAKPSPRKGTRTVKDAPCPVCKFKTDPPHDARRHRAQGNHKKPFTQQQLKEMAYTKVS